jgi:hypothetical protein
MDIYLPEVDWPLDYGLPSKLYAVTLHKIAISDMLGVDPSRLEDAQLAEACLTAESKAGDIVCLAGCGALRDMSCLVGLEQLQELDISRCNGVDATTVAKVVADNQALSKLIFGGNKVISWHSEMKPATLEVGMTEASFGSKNLGAGGAVITSAWLTHKDKGALSVANVMGNHIGKEQLAKLQEIMHSKPNLVSLCGIADDATEADLSGLGMDADDAAILASELPDKGALSSFTFGGKQVVTMTAVMTDANFSGKLESYEAQIVAAFLPKCT